MSGFFEELQRRKVYRVAAAYVVAAGFLIQIASAALPAWDLPSWSLRLVIALLLIGFPIALILAWAYDITAHGIQITPTTPEANRRRNQSELYFGSVWLELLRTIQGAFRRVTAISSGVGADKVKKRVRTRKPRPSQLSHK